MADEILKRDSNRITVLGGITDDSNQEIRMLRVDPVTGALKIVDSGATSGDVFGPSSAVDGNIVTFDGITGKLIKDSGAKLSDYQLALGFTPENVANKSTDVSTDGSSDTKYPSVKAVKTYADGLVAGLLDYRGAYDASGNTYPTTGGSGTAGAVMKGDMWIISVAGTLGGDAVQIGDSIIANTDTPGQTAGNWNILNSNISYVPEDVANKVTSLSGASTDTQYPSAKLVYDQLAGKQATGSYEVTTNKETSALDTSTTKYPCNNVVKSAIPVKATGAEIDTGTDDAKFATAKAITDSKLSFTDGTETLTNKRINTRVTSATSYTTDTGTSLTVANCDEFVITAQAGALKFNNPSGTPTEGQKLIVRIKDDGTARALTYDTQFRAMGNALPSTTVVNKTLYMGFIYNATDTKWDLVAVAQEA